MDRRRFVGLMVGISAGLVVPGHLLARQATPTSNATPIGDWPTLDVQIDDKGFHVPKSITAGRTLLRATNIGTSEECHWALGRFPDGATDAEINELMMAPDGAKTTIQWEQIGFVGVPDWPKPGGPAVTGIVDLHPGRYVAFAPISDREPTMLEIGGTFIGGPEPTAEVDVDLHEFVITLPDTAHTSKPVRWKITNTGGTLHDVAVLPVPADFTADDFMALLMLPDGATPTPGMKVIDYNPVAAIGILGLATTTWLDVQLEPGHYMAVCMLPFGTGYPHAMDGMLVFFEVA
jgi:hypothetical protein